MYGWEFPPHISGGLGVACLGMTRALKDKGHDIAFVLPRLRQGAQHGSPVRLLAASPETGVVKDDAGKTQWASPEGVEISLVDSPLVPYLDERAYRSRLVEREGSSQTSPVAKEGHRLELTGDYGPDLMSEVDRYARVAGGIAARVPHDIIHAHDWLTMLAGIEAKRMNGKPLVVHVHALEPDRSGEAVNPVVFGIERVGMAAADRVVAVSHYTKEIIVKRYGIDPSKVTVVHNAVSRRDPGVLPTRDLTKRRDKIVLFLGRITFQKGPDYFIEAAARVMEDRRHVHFVIAGSGDMAPRMIERVAELRKGRRIHFTGFLSGAAVERIFLMSDVYVMPSVSEPFGISPLEAMCYDVPVIISRQSGVSEVLKHALKVDFWDVDDMASKIISLIDHPPLHRELVSQGARELEKIQWANTANSLTDLYAELTG
jgi:glycogen synthase